METALTHPDFDFPVNYSVATLPDGNTDQVVSTIDMMRQFARQDSQSPVLYSSLRDFQEVKNISDPCQLSWEFAKSLLRFQRDELTGGSIDPDTVEVLVRPVDAVLLYKRSGVKSPGDWDCFSMLVAACLLALHVPCSFATVAADSSDPTVWSHVYVVAWPGSARRTPIDASHGPVCGWEVPGVGRYTEWPLMGGGERTAIVLGFLIALGGLLYYMWGQNK